MAKNKATEKGVGTVVYCGPSVPGIAKQFTFYTNGLPASLAAAIREYPPMEGLLVPLDRLPEAMKALNGQRGHIYRLFRLVQTKF